MAFPGSPLDNVDDAVANPLTTKFGHMAANKITICMNKHNRSICTSVRVCVHARVRTRARVCVSRGGGVVPMLEFSMCVVQSTLVRQLQ